MSEPTEQLRGMDYIEHLEAEVARLRAVIENAFGVRICAQCHGFGEVGVLSGEMRVCPRCLGSCEEPDAGGAIRVQGG